MSRSMHKATQSVSEMLSEAEVREILYLAAEPYGPADNKKWLIAKAARALSLTYSRAKRLWYAEDDCPLRAEQAAQLRAERARLLRLREERLGREIEDTRRLIQEALRREEARTEVRRDGQSASQLDLPFIRRSA